MAATAQRERFVHSIVNKVDYPHYAFRVVGLGDALAIQGEYFEADTVTGKMELQKTRLWHIAESDTEDEIVRTMFKCIMTSAEHKAREHFRYEGYAVMNPHFSVQQYKHMVQEANANRRRK